MARPTTKGLITKTELINIGNAVRQLTGTQDLLTPQEMASKIRYIPIKTKASLKASGARVTVPSGYYREDFYKDIASGTAGTPKATKGNVANHAVTITCSVTNTAGYIAGGTKAGDSVSVSASELVSGTLQVAANGTFDVTNYENVNVNIFSPLEWDTWVFKDEIGADLSFPDITLYFCVPMMLTDGRQVLGVEIYYYDTGSTDSAYMNYFIGGSASATEVYTYADYGSTNTWVSDTYKTIKVPSYVRLFASATTTDMGSPPYMYKRLYEFLSGAATLQ